MWTGSMTDQQSRPFSDLLRERRKQLGLSQFAAAQLIGASEKSWRRWEKGAPPDEKFLDAIRERFGISAVPPTTPQAAAAQALADLEQTIAVVRESLDRATNVRADIVLARPDGSTILIEIKAFRDAGATDEGLEQDAAELITSAAHHAGWTVHITP